VSTNCWVIAIPELIVWTSGDPSLQRFGKLPRWPSKELLDETTGYKLDYTAPASQVEAIQNYEKYLVCREMKIKIFLGRLVREFGFGSRKLI